MKSEIKRSKGWRQDIPLGMTDLLDLLRLATVDTVEAISLWRLAQEEPTLKPFLWNGEDYLVKVLHDCDFLDSLHSLREWLGFSLYHNPLLMPGGAVHGTSPRNSPQEIQGDIVNIGCQPWQGPLFLASHPFRNYDKEKRELDRSEKRRFMTPKLTPYAAPVVNNPTLLPSPSSNGTGLTGARARPLSDVEVQPSVQVNLTGIVPNTLHRVDYGRVRAAEKTLAEEEIRLSLSEVGGMPSSKPKRESRVTFAMERVAPEGRRISESQPSNRQSEEGSTLIRCHGSYPGQGKMALSERTQDSAVSVLNNLARTASRLLDRQPPEPTAALGPIRLRSESPDGGLHNQPFVHSLSKGPLPSTALPNP
ncbi:unnamed protein product [Choristocarpus tenellus]